MTLKNRFRLIVGLSLAFAVASAVPSFFLGGISEEWKIVLQWHGNEGVFEKLLDNLPESGVARAGLLIVLISFLTYVVAVQVGMFLFWRFARVGYLLLTAGFVVLVSLDGLVVMTPFEAALCQLSLILDGAVLAIAYLQPISSYFEKLPNPSINTDARR